jgi:hypothetical protein
MLVVVSATKIPRQMRAHDLARNREIAFRNEFTPWIALTSSVRHDAGVHLNMSIVPTKVSKVVRDGWERSLCWDGRRINRQPAQPRWRLIA